MIRHIISHAIDVDGNVPGNADHVPHVGLMGIGKRSSMNCAYMRPWEGKFGLEAEHPIVRKISSAV